MEQDPFVGHEKGEQVIPRFITFEGGEGTGKSTQLTLLAAFLKEKGIPFLATREPGGTPLGEAIRDLFLSDIEEDSVSELLLVMAARFAHIERVIAPALSAGMWVLCDRFIDSSAVYQGILSGRSPGWVWDLHEKADMKLIPDLTFILSSAQAAERKRQKNRFDRAEHTFHEAVREGYKCIAKENPERCVLIETTVSREETAREIVSHICPFFS